MKHHLTSFVAACALALAVGAGAQAATLRYATIGEPPSLDVQMGTATLATTIAQHVFETLYAFDSKGAPQPLLAEGEKLADEGKTIVITLRKGVPFHNGKEMKAADVAASLTRWGKFGARGKSLGLVSAEATGENEVTLKLSAPNGAWKNFLAFPNGGPVIYPADIVTAAGGEPIKAEGYVGTGPYRFVELRPNRHVRLTKFDKYASRSEAADGPAGARKATIDTIEFVPVPDVGTRMSGVQAGDYDYAEYISGDLFASVKTNAALKAYISDAPIFGEMFLNHKQGPFASNLPLRRAVLAALNLKEALQVSVGDPALWKANGAIFPEGSVWHTEAGVKAYNVGDARKAAEMAKQAGYKGEPLRLLVSTNYQQHFDQANVFKRQLADAGINVTLNVTDWATLLKQRAEPAAWDMFMTHHGPAPDPVLLTFMSDAYPGWWASANKQKLAVELNATTDPKTRQAVWAKLQELLYEEVPIVKVGDVFSFDIGSAKMKPAWERSPAFPYFWGATK